MTGTLFLKPAWRRGYLPDVASLYLMQDKGLCHREDGREDGAMIAVNPVDHGIDRTLAGRIDDWTGVYRQLSEGLPGSWRPEHCRDFDIQRHNCEGLAIARSILTRLPDGQHLCFRPVKRKGAWFRSRLLEQMNPLANWKLASEQGGPPLPGYRDDARDPERWVRVMGDYSSNGIWHWDGCEMRPDDLPIPAELTAQLADWAAGYFSWTDSWRDGEADRFDRIREDDRLLRLYSDDGLAIACAIKTILPDWTVVYFDEELSGRHAIRARFEFEIG